jgi:uncharacterized protein (DUF486 family)
MNNIENYVLFIILILIASFFNCFANFYSKIPGIKGSFYKIFAISLLFAIIEYSIKIPTIFYFGKNLNSIANTLIILTCIFASLMIYSIFILKEKVPLITYFTFALIITILFIHSYLINKLHKQT